MKDAQNLTLPRAGAGASPKKSGAPRRKLSGGLRKAEVVMQGIFLVCGLIAVAFVLLISIYLIISGIPAIREVGLFNFLFGDTWSARNDQYGILAMILTSVYGTAGAIVIGVPVGFLTAVFLAKVAPAWLVRLIRPAVELLAGHPLRGLRPGGYDGAGALDPHYLQPPCRRQSLCRYYRPGGHDPALHYLRVGDRPSGGTQGVRGGKPCPGGHGAGDLLPGQRPCPQGAVSPRRWCWASARAIGEAMAIIMVAGNVANMPSIFQSVRFLTTGIAVEMNYASPGSLQRNALYSIGLVLFLFIMLINVVLNVVLKREKEN